MGFAKNNYITTEWSKLFEQIAYAHEARYPPHYWIDGSIERISFYKLTLSSNGETEYKGSVTYFNPSLWPRVKLLYKLFEKDNVIDTLYGKK